MSVCLNSRFTHNLMESRLQDKKIEAESLTKSLEGVQAQKFRSFNQLTQEQHNMTEASRSLKRQQESVADLNREISQRVDADQSMTLRVKQVEADAKLLQEEVDAKLSEEEKCKTWLPKREE